MIGYDATEAKHMTMLKSWRSLAHLEEMTGADFIVSPLNLPAHSETMLAKHLQAGAFLVQRKTGMDLIGSISETGNLWDMMDRMLQFCKKHHPNAHPAQRVFLGMGLYYGVKGDALMVNNKSPKSQTTYWQLQGAIERIFERGCVFVSVSAGPEGLFKWLITKEHHALDNVKHPKKHSVVKPPAMTEFVKELQGLVVIRDARRTLVTFPGMGESNVNTVWDYADCNLARALELITDPALVKQSDKPAGIALGKIQAWRDWLGLQENELIQVTRIAK